MLSFRKKILLSDLLLFLVFVAFLFPFVERTVKSTTVRTLRTRAVEQVKSLESLPDLQSVIDYLQQPEFFFQVISIWGKKGNLIWDSHPSSNLHQIQRSGKIYTEEYFPYFHQTFGYVHLPLTIQGQKYVFQAGFPLQEINDLRFQFEIGFVVFGGLLLLLYSLITQLIIHRATRPFQQITRDILDYTEGRAEFLPRIILKQPDQGAEFDKLAYTLNSLSERVQKELDHLTQQRKETEGILESLAEGVIAFSPTGHITFANRVAYQMLGTPHGKLIGHLLGQSASRYPDLVHKGHELLVQVLQTSEPIVQTWTTKTGSRLYLELIAAPLAQQNGVLLVLQDKTSDYKVLEMGKDFIANASHELRTPITIILGFAETLQDLPEISQNLLKDITDKIVRTCFRIDKLVKSLLTLSDIENLTKTNFQSVDLKLLVENCKSYVLAVHPETKIAIHSDLLHAFILADPDLFEMAISNLLDNAVKYSQPPARIEIRLHQEGNEILLEIQDNGIGIPEGDIPHIFDRFYTVDKARSRKSGGAGLGLSIVKTIIDKHDGKITVVSRKGKGTTFTIALSLVKPH